MASNDAFVDWLFTVLRDIKKQAHQPEEELKSHRRTGHV